MDRGERAAFEAHALERPTFAGEIAARAPPRPARLRASAIGVGTPASRPSSAIGTSPYGTSSVT